MRRDALDPRGSIRASERVRVRLLLDGHPLPLGELLPIGGTADARAVAGSPASAKRNVRLVGDGLVVDVQQPGVEAIADGDRAADVPREHPGREAVLATVG